MRAINLMRVLALPTALSTNVLYLLKKTTGSLNVWMSDKTGLRPAVAYREIRLTGPEEIYLSGTTALTAQYVISNFDILKTYTASISAGSVSISGNTLTVTAPTVAGDIYLKVNGELSKIRVRANGVKRPSILMPYFDGSLVRPSFTAKISTFAVSSGTDTCAQTEVRTSPISDFSSGVVTYTQAGAVPNMVLTNVPVSPLLFLQARYVGSTYGASDWSKSITIAVEDWSYPASEVARLKPSDASAGDGFGNSVAVSGNGNVVIAGCHLDDDKGLDSGSAYIYNCTTDIWAQKTKLVATDGAAGDYFGETVAINADGNLVMVGAPCKDSYKGAVYIFQLVDNVWSQKFKLTASDAQANDYFGYSLVLNAAGTVALIAAKDDDNVRSASGNVYAFAWNGSAWNQTQKIAASDPNASLGFGFSLALNTDGDIALVGSPSDANGGTLKGAVYVFVSNAGVWSQLTKLSASDAANSDHFGTSVSLNGAGNVAVSSSPYSNSSKGSAYVFSRTDMTWTQQAKIEATDGVAADSFGTSLVLNELGDILLSSSPYAKISGVEKGAVYVHKGVSGAWIQLSKITGSIAALNDGYGKKMGISYKGQVLAVGSPGSDDVASDSGSVYFYK